MTLVATGSGSFPLRATGLVDQVARAYSATGAAWQRGPGRVYDRLAEVVVGHSPVPIAGQRCLDAGAGTGAASRALLAGGAGSVIAADVAAGMLAQDAPRRPLAVVADVCALPFLDGAFDAAVAAFCLNHLVDPVAGLAELARVLRPGGGIVASVYAADDAHPAKAIVEDVLAAHGWVAPSWYGVVDGAARRLSSPTSWVAAARAARLDAAAINLDVAFPELTAVDLATWRLGMAHHAPFVASLPPAVRAEVTANAERRLRATPPLVRSIIVITATRRWTLR